MTSIQLSQKLEQYKVSLATLEEAKQPPPEQVLEILLIRDEIYFLLNEQTQKQTKLYSTLHKLDAQLKKKSHLITQTVDLESLRTSFNPSTDAWWWKFSPSTHKWNQFDWLWKFLTLTVLTACISLIFDISSRFLSSGPDTLGAFAITTQSVLTLVASGSAFTTFGRNEIQRFLEQIKIPKHFHQEISFGFSVLLFLGLITFHLHLPKIAIFYGTHGNKLFYESNPPKLASAINSYKRSLELNPNDVESRYSLGLIYEITQDYELARDEYKIAAQGNHPPAYNNLARLYIFDEDYYAASHLLQLGLEASKKSDSTDNDKISEQYALLKNLGWARLKQQRYQEAEIHLSKAIQLDMNRGIAHCLLAQVYEEEEDINKALTEWEFCFAYTNPLIMDEDQFIHLARQRLEKARKEP